MYMKLLFHKSHVFTLIIGLLSGIIFLCAPVSTLAQSKTPAKVNTKKTTRVFYGQASYYSNKFHGRRTASGEIFNQKKLTCACNVLPLGTWIKVTNLKNGKTVVVKVNDRIHPRMKRIVDLSRAAATQLGFISRGLTRVKVEVVANK